MCLEIEHLDASEMVGIFLVDMIRNNLYFQCVTFQQLCISSLQNSPEKARMVLFLSNRDIAPLPY